MKGKVNVTALYSQQILFTPSVDGFEKRGRFGEKRGRERERATKHINKVTGGLKAHPFFFFLLFFFSQGKTTVAMNVFPMNLPVQA